MRSAHASSSVTTSTTRRPGLRRSSRGSSQASALRSSPTQGFPVSTIPAAGSFGRRWPQRSRSLSFPVPPRSRRRSSRAAFSPSSTGFSGTCRAARASSTALWTELRKWHHPAVAFESPKRVGASLASLAAIDPGRMVAVCRELTKLHEEVVIGTADELAERFVAGARGEITVVIGGADARPGRR